jgi:uncharacterized protein YndB with AHSA1/START domain
VARCLEGLGHEVVVADRTSQRKAAAMSFEMRSSRIFPVTVEQVYAAWTEPELVRQWWGPTGFTCPVARMNVREGGVSLVAMRAPPEFGGRDMYNTWTYERVQPPSRLEYTLRFATADGSHITSAEAGIPGNVPDAVPHVVTFEPAGDGRSRVTVVETGYPDAATRDMSRAGLEQCLDKLERLLTTGANGMYRRWFAARAA